MRNEFNIDILEVLKNQNKKPLNLKNVKTHFSNILKLLINIEKQKQKECIFVIDRFHFSYLSYLNCDVSDFLSLENSINDFSYCLFLGFKNYTQKAIYNRQVQSLDIRGKNHGFTNHFNKIIADDNKGLTPEERIYNHYLTRHNVYNQAFKKTKLKNKVFIEIDSIIKKEDYNQVLEKLNNNILEFTLSNKKIPQK